MSFILIGILSLPSFFGLNHFLYEKHDLCSEQNLHFHEVEIDCCTCDFIRLDIESGSLDFAQELIIQNPPVYVARTKDTKTEIEYFTAKTFWPLPDGERKEIKVYVGKAYDYGGDTLNERAKQDAIKKMQETLRRRKNAGEI